MTSHQLAIATGIDLADEQGLGSLTMTGWLREVCARNEAKDALVFQEHDERIVWTYAELWQKANEVARSLLAQGVTKGSRVGVLMTNRPEFLSAVWGASLAGGVAVTISTFSSRDELAYMLKLSCCQILLFERSVLKKDFAELLVDIDPAIDSTGATGLMSEELPYLRHLVCLGDPLGVMEDWSSFLARSESVAQTLVNKAAESVSPADPGAIFFSSGSTANPKGIINSHRAVALQLWRWKRFYQLSDDARTWSANGFFWSGNFGMAIGGTLTAGGCLVLQKTFNPEEALSIMDSEQATMAIAWPHQWPQLEAAPNWQHVNLSSMKYLNPSAGLANHPTVDVSWDEPINAYGNTETFTISASYESGTPDDVIAGSSGAPVPGMTFKIVDPFSGDTLLTGEEGEIAVKGPTLMLGYIGTPLDNTLDSDGFLRTGDAGYLDDEGRLYWKGRLSDIIKTGGANVSPAEIDAVLRQIPGVKVVQTVGVPHENLGEIVVSCIVPHDDSDLTEDVIKRAAKDKLASYKVPRAVLFFDETEIELTGSAKIKTGELKSLVVERLSQ